MAIKISQEEFDKKFGAGLSPTASQPVQGNSISQAFNAGIDKTKQGYNEAKNAQNPGQLFEGSLGAASGLIGAASSPLAPITKPIGKAIDYTADKISNIPAVQNFANSKAGDVTTRAVQNISNINDVVGAVAGLKGGGQVASKGLNATSEAVTPTLNAVGRTLKNTGEGAYGITVTPQESTLNAMQVYQAKQPGLFNRVKSMVAGTEPEGKPITEANTAARHGLTGTEWQLGVQAKQVSNNLWKQNIQPKLQAVKGTVDMRNFLAEVEKDIKKSGGDLTRRSSLSEALNAVKQDYKNVSKVNLEKLQDYKEGWAEFLPDATYKGKPIGAALKQVHKLMAEKARGVIYKHVGEEGKQAYIDYGNLKSIEKAGLKSGLGDPAAKSLSKNAWQFVMNKVITPVATVGGKILYRTGEGLEFVGNKGAKKVGDVIKH